MVIRSATKTTTNIATKIEKPVDYEMVVVLNPQVTDDKLSAVIGTITALITSRGGSVSETTRWGKRALAYPIKHFTAGTYYLLRFSLNTNASKEVEHALKISENVLRHLLIRLDDKKAVKVPAVAPATPAAE